MGILSIGVTGLNAAQTGLLTTSHNIANASTPGYSRQYTVQGTNVALYSGAGYVGQGGHVETVRRSYDQLLARNVLSAEAGASEMDSYLSQIHQIDNMFADVDSGLSPSLANFFRAGGTPIDAFRIGSTDGALQGARRTAGGCIKRCQFPGDDPDHPDQHLQ